MSRDGDRAQPAAGDRAQPAAGGRAQPAAGDRAQPTARGRAQPGESLADRQAALVAALTAGAPVPPGFDADLVQVARAALLRKRAGEAARQWPDLAGALAGRWLAEFTGWAAQRPTRGSLRDGWDLARDLLARGALPRAAGEELATREVTWRYDGTSAPRPRRAPALRRVTGSVVLQIAGRPRTLRRGG